MENNQTPVIKAGNVERFKEGFFSDSWTKEYLELHQDSTLVWYSKPNSRSAQGGVLVADVCNFMAAGSYTRVIRTRPELPAKNRENHVLAMPNTATRDPMNINWFLFADDQDLNEWMKAICGTLPPRPPPAKQPPAPPQQAVPPPQQAVPPPPQRMPPPQQAPGPVVQQAGYPPAQYPPVVAYPQQPVVYQQQPVLYPQQQGYVGQPAHTTVVVQEREREDSGDGMATGMLLGMGVGMAVGGLGSGGGRGESEVNVTNNYEVNVTEVENTNVNETNYNDGGFAAANEDQGGFAVAGYDEDSGGFFAVAGYDDSGSSSD